MEPKQVNPFVAEIQRLNSARHLAFMKRIKERTAEYITKAMGDSVPAKLKQSIVAFAEAYAEEDGYYLRVSKSALTVQLEVADKERDTVLAGVRALAEAMKRLGTAEQQEAAAMVLERMQLYKLSGSLKYEDEGIQMDQFVADCQKNSKLIQAVTKLGLTDHIASMKTANDEAIRLVNLRNQERAYTDTQSLRKARQAMDDAYRQLMFLLNAFAAVEEDDGVSPYDACIQVMNEDIKYYRRYVMPTRVNKKADDKTKPEPTPEPTPEPEPAPEPDSDDTPDDGQES